jgi:hypothetical protein
MEEVRKVGGVRRSLACGARLPNTLHVLPGAYLGQLKEGSELTYENNQSTGQLGATKSIRHLSLVEGGGVASDHPPNY